MERYCNNSSTRIIDLLNSNKELGLQEDRCKLLRRKYGDNRVLLSKKTSIYTYILESLKGRGIILCLLAIIPITMFKYYILGIVLLAIFIINMILSVLNLKKKYGLLNELDKVSSTNATVVRDGVQIKLSDVDLVIGDIVFLEKGCIVPADLRLIEVDSLRVNEKFITGEKKYRKKIDTTIIGNVELTNADNIAFKGSTVKAGSAIGIVIQTGPNTQLGKIIAMHSYADSKKRTLGSCVYGKLKKNLMVFLISTILIGFLVMHYGQGLGKESFVKALFALACCPFMIIIELSISKVYKKFKDNGIEIINFSVFSLVENLNTLFLDKIGSVSQENMVVKSLYVNNEIISADDPYIKELTFDRMVDISLICNNAKYYDQTGDYAGNIDEVAFMQYAERKKINLNNTSSRVRKIINLPMEDDKRFTTVVTRIDRGFRANTRGNIDSVLEKCTHIMENGIEKEITKEQRQNIKDVDMQLSLSGLTTQGFAYRNFSYQPSKDENIESNMVFVGVIGLDNPLEEDLENRLSIIKSKSILPILFTEESKLTAIRNFKNAGIIKNSNQVIAGIELDSLNQSELKELLCRARVFCRINSEIKSKIVSLFIKDGYNVATAGEELCDLPCLNVSNVGISKGKASEMVKKLSDVYISGNYLNGLISIKKYARIFKTNIQNIFRTYIIIILTEILMMLSTTLLGQEYALDATSIIGINVFLFIPISLILISGNGNSITINEVILRTIILSSIGIFNINKLNGIEATIVPINIISIGVTLLAVFNARISIKNLSMELRLAILSLIICICTNAIIIIKDNIVVSINAIVQISISLVILFIIEFLYGKWKYSVTR